MMHQIQLNGTFYRSWTGACPGVEAELKKAKACIDGFTYHEVAPGEYPEGEDSSHFDLSTGNRILRKAPPEGFKYDGENIDSILVPADRSEVLTAWIETQCDAVDSEYFRRLKETGFTYSDGFAYPLDLGAQAAYQAELMMVDRELLPEPIAERIDNGRTVFTVEGFKQFAIAAFVGGDEMQKARKAAKVAMRNCETYEDALPVFNAYMEW